MRNLKEEFNKSNIKCIEGTCIIANKLPIIEINQLNEYINLLSDLKAKNVFYSLCYYDDEEYFIDEDIILDEYGEKALNLAKDKISEYNKKMESFDFDIPYRINLYFIKDNIAYLSYLEDDWLNQHEVFTANVELEIMIEDIEPELEKVELEHQKSVEELGQELKKLILNDEEFKFCSNQSLRASYTRKLMNSTIFEKYKIYFKIGNGRYNDIDIYNFVELLWKKMNSK
ncbi:MAG: hypothetical protein RSD47_00630 [Romboutsia sp.]